MTMFVCCKQLGLATHTKIYDENEVQRTRIYLNKEVNELHAHRFRCQRVMLVIAPMRQLYLFLIYSIIFLKTK